jgi:spore coat polysaccharide biosynthesis protein SpsF
LIDPQLVDDVVQSLYENQADFCANRLPPPFERTFPIGLDVEAVFFSGLERAWNEAETKFEREHVMPYFYDDPDRFSVALLHAEENYGQYRWTVDNPEDLQLIEKLAGWFQGRRDFSWKEVLSVFEAHPEWQQINAKIHHKSFLDVDHRSESDTDQSRVEE